MTNRNKKSRITVAGSLPDMVCTPKRASHLLQGLRKDYRLLTPQERNQVKCFILGFLSERLPPPYNPNALKSEVEH
jgi:hypothetical protein